MQQRKQSFLERLTGTQIIHDDVVGHDEMIREASLRFTEPTYEEQMSGRDTEDEYENVGEAGLPVDM